MGLKYIISDRMPHFYRYRADDEDLQTHARTPARTTAISASKTEEAHVRCLGVAGEICIPSGDDKNKEFRLANHIMPYKFESFY